MASERTTSDVLVERLSDWGVERVFGYSGDGIDGVMGALRRAGRPQFVQARHEEAATPPRAAPPAGRPRSARPS